MCFVDVLISSDELVIPAKACPRGGGGPEPRHATRSLPCHPLTTYPLPPWLR